jgi:hypothetical protein
MLGNDADPNHEHKNLKTNLIGYSGHVGGSIKFHCRQRVLRPCTVGCNKFEHPPLHV